EALDLAQSEGGVRVSRREVAHHADDLPRGPYELAGAPASHPRVELHMDRDPLGNLPVDRDDLEAGVARRRELVARHRPEGEDAGVGERAPKLDRLLERRRAERGRAGFERGAADVDCTVAVAVG